MTTNFIYSLTYSVLIVFFAMNSFNISSPVNSKNNTFTFLDNTEKIHQDTTPHHSKNKETYRSNSDNQKIYLTIEDGEIKKLKINGRKIPKSEYKNYNDLITELRSSKNAPTPPIPPTPPSSIAMAEVERAQEEIKEAHQQIEKAHQQIAEAQIEIEKSHSTSEAIVQALIEDELIEEEQDYTIYLSQNKFKVNGIKQDKATHQKYLHLYEKLTGGSMSKNSIYQVSHNN
ncbi:MAG: hypothetical protein AB8F94_24950 [Saprospiraceae bacterium]